MKLYGAELSESPFLMMQRKNAGFFRGGFLLFFSEKG